MNLSLPLAVRSIKMLLIYKICQPPSLPLSLHSPVPYTALSTQLSVVFQLTPPLEPAVPAKSLKWAEQTWLSLPGPAHPHVTTGQQEADLIFCLSFSGPGWADTRILPFEGTCTGLGYCLCPDVVKLPAHEAIPNS